MPKQFAGFAVVLNDQKTLQWEFGKYGLQKLFVVFLIVRKSDHSMERSGMLVCRVADIGEISLLFR